MKKTNFLNWLVESVSILLISIVSTVILATLMTLPGVIIAFIFNESTDGIITGGLISFLISGAAFLFISKCIESDKREDEDVDKYEDEDEDEYEEDDEYEC